MICLKILVIFFIVPTLLGLLITNFMKEKNNVFFGFVLGIITEFASFEIIYLLMYFMSYSLKILELAWLLIILIMCVISIIINAKRSKEIFKSQIKLIKSLPITILLFILLISIQMYFPARYMQIVDPDDAFYVASVTTTIETNSLFKYNPYDGTEYQEMPLRYSLSGLFAYFATISEFLDIHPAIVMHTIFPPIIILSEYIVYALLANKLFNGNKEKVSYFLIILATIHIFGYISIYTNFSFFAYRSWQGKSLIANFCLPLEWLMYLYCIENSNKVIYWLNLLFVMISACFVTCMGVFLAPIILAILSLINFIQNKKFNDVVKAMLCCLPEVILGLIYLVF